MEGPLSSAMSGLEGQAHDPKEGTYSYRIQQTTLLLMSRSVQFHQLQFDPAYFQGRKAGQLLQFAELLVMVIQSGRRSRQNNFHYQNCNA